MLPAGRAFPAPLHGTIRAQNMTGAHAYPLLEARTDLYHGLFRWHTDGQGRPVVSRYDSSPASIPCPTTGRSLRVATLDAGSDAICPACSGHGHGGFVSFVGDL